VFGRSRRSLRAEIRALEASLDVSKRETRAARGDCGIATRDMETWRRRAIENADRLIAEANAHRECRRQLAAHERQAQRLAQLEAANDAAYQVVLTRPALPRQRKTRALEVAS
jgi:hypothetical protein